MGNAGSKTEKEIITSYKNFKMDILKVGYKPI
jgi:beta-lactamase superfamily II metal-dependent hydrolase